ncbi:MAG: hypothetical protein HOV83_31020 [Catenulispora sp.]|nr:hypothetical protein [Catenulispora sp.]
MATSNKPVSRPSARAGQRHDRGAAQLTDAERRKWRRKVRIYAAVVSVVVASTDGGVSLRVRNALAGQSFMGTILVDPAAGRPGRRPPDVQRGFSRARSGSGVMIGS